MGKLRDVYDEVWRALAARDLETAANHLAPNCQFVVPGASVRGFQRARPFFQAYLQAFPDTRTAVKAVVEDGKSLVVRSTLIGTNSGILPTRGGDVPPTGREVAWETVEWLTFRGGKIAEWRLYQDPTPFMNALTGLQTRVLSAVQGRQERAAPQGTQAARCIATMVTA